MSGRRVCAAHHHGTAPDESRSPASPRAFPPLAAVAASSSSSYAMSGPSSHTRRVFATNEPVNTSAADDDALHWERSFHSEVAGSPRILLASPTASHRRASDRNSNNSCISEASPTMNPSSHTPLSAWRGGSFADSVSEGALGSLHRPSQRTAPGLSPTPLTPSAAAGGTTTTTNVPSPARRVTSTMTHTVRTYGATKTRTTHPHTRVHHSVGMDDSAAVDADEVADATPDQRVLLHREERHRERMRQRLLNEDFFSSPFRKWRRDGRFPFKLLNNILIFICLLIQLTWYQLPEAVANEQQRQAIVHHFTGSDTYLSRAKGNLVSRPTLFLDEQVQVFQSIESFVNVYYNLTNTSVSELNFYYWQQNTTDSDKLLQAYHQLGAKAGQGWTNGEEVLQLLQDYQRRKRVKAYVRASQIRLNKSSDRPQTGAKEHSSLPPASLFDLSMVQPVVMQVLAYPFSLRERSSPSQATPRWFTFLLDAKNPLGPFRHYNRSHAQHRQQLQQPPSDTDITEGHRQYQREVGADLGTDTLSDADLHVRAAHGNTTLRTNSAGQDARVPITRRRRRTPDAALLQVVCHARLDVLTGRYYSPCRTPALSEATKDISTGIAVGLSSTPHVRQGSHALTSATAASVSSDLLFSFMDNVVSVRLFASVRHLSIPAASSARVLSRQQDAAATTASRRELRADLADGGEHTLYQQRQTDQLYARHSANRPAMPFHRSVYRWMMEKNLRIHRGGMVEAELVVRTSVVRLQPRYGHPAFVNAFVLAALAACEIHLRRRALGRIQRYRRRVALEKHRLCMRTAWRGHDRADGSDCDSDNDDIGTDRALARYVAEEKAARRVRQGATPLISPSLPTTTATTAALSSTSSSSSLSSSSSDSVDQAIDSADKSPEADGDDESAIDWVQWLRVVWWELRLGINDELGFHAPPSTMDVDGAHSGGHAYPWTHTAQGNDNDDRSRSPRTVTAASAEQQPLLPSHLRRRQSFRASSSQVPSCRATASSAAVRALVSRRTEAARQERLLARRYVSLQDSWRYQLQQSMGVGWHRLAMLSASLTLVYAVLYLGQLVPVPTGSRTDTLRSLSLGLACLSSSVVFLSYTRYFPRVYFPILITKVVIPRLLIFALSIAPLFMGYALFFHIVFGSHSDGRFSTVGWSMMSLYFMAYGDSLLSAINTSERGASYAVSVLANIMTILFVLLFMMTILNFALGITIHEWHRIRQQFGTVLNMSSILFSVRTREEVKAEALEKVRTNLELLLYMKYEDEQSTSTVNARESLRRHIPSTPSLGCAPLTTMASEHTASADVSHSDATLAPTEPLMLPPPATTTTSTITQQLILDSADAPAVHYTAATLARLSSVTSIDGNESVQLSAVTTLGRVSADAHGRAATTPREADHRDEASSRSGLSDEL